LYYKATDLIIAKNFKKHYIYLKRTFKLVGLMEQLNAQLDPDIGRVNEPQRLSENVSTMPAFN
jgi:hypothetical protein